MMHRVDFKAMGTSMTAMLNSPDPQIYNLLAHLPARFEEWEQCLSRFRAKSELNRLNHAAGLPLRVSQALWDVCMAAHEMEHLSAGLVRATLRGALEQAGYDHSFEQITPLPSLAPPAHWNSAHSLDEVYFNEEEHSLCLPAGLELDFGGVAKGWCATQTLQTLAKFGPALVSAGGDMAIGAGEWPVTVNDPFHPGEIIATLRLQHCGLATSGTERRRWRQGHTWHHHIIDPRTGRPAQSDVLTATAIAPNALLAEMAAKIGLILGSTAGLQWFNAHPGFHTLMVLESGEVLFSADMPQFFWSENEYQFE